MKQLPPFRSFCAALAIAWVPACSSSNFAGNSNNAKQPEKTKQEPKDDPEEKDQPAAKKKTDGPAKDSGDAGDAAPDTETDLGNAAAAEAAIAEDGEKSKSRVVKLTAKIAWDGNADFCVDFAAGKVSIQNLPGRFTSTLYVDFAITLKGGDVKTAKFDHSSPLTTLPGDWSKVTGATLGIANLRGCTESDRDPPIANANNNGTLTCTHLNDDQHDQSGAGCFDADWNIQFQ